MPNPANKALWHVSVTSQPEAEDALAEALSRVLGQPVSSYHDVRCDHVRLDAYLHRLPLPADRLRAAIQAAIRHVRECGLNPGQTRITVRQLPPTNWITSWKHHFKAFEIESALLIKPSWSRRRARPGQRVIVLDPGLSFGTGHHPTTRFCLEHLTRSRSRRLPQSLLDIGTGSGLLAIAAAKLGYQPVTAFDNDPVSVRVARANAQRNRVADRLTLRRLDLRTLAPRPRRRSDVVCANLTADLLLQECERITGQVQPGGILLLAGILRTELEGVRRAYERRGFRTEHTRAEGEWGSIRFRQMPGTDS